MKRHAVRCCFVLTMFGFTYASGISAHEGEKHLPSEAVTAEGTKSDSAYVSTLPYPLDVCPVSGEDLGSMGAMVIQQYKGREVRFCCPDCQNEYEKDLEASLAALDSLIIATQKADYPLEVCVVSGDRLGGAMGDPVDYVYGNQLVRLCCEMCVDAFSEDPASHMKKLETAYETTRARRDGQEAPGPEEGSGDHSGHRHGE